VAAHVLGDNVARLSIYRDGFQPLHPREGEHFPAFLYRINEEWVTAARRISPALLIELLSSTGDQVIELWRRHYAPGQGTRTGRWRLDLHSGSHPLGDRPPSASRPGRHRVDRLLAIQTRDSRHF
jgi:hypothetical protein